MGTTSSNSSGSTTPRSSVLACCGGGERGHHIDDHEQGRLDRLTQHFRLSSGQSPFGSVPCTDGRNFGVSQKGVPTKGYLHADHWDMQMFSAGAGKDGQELDRHFNMHHQRQGHCVNSWGETEGISQTESGVYYRPNVIKRGMDADDG